MRILAFIFALAFSTAIAQAGVYFSFSYGAPVYSYPVYPVYSAPTYVVPNYIPFSPPVYQPVYVGPQVFTYSHGYCPPRPVYRGHGFTPRPSHGHRHR